MTEIATKTPPPMEFCQICGIEFQPTRHSPRIKYCGKECRSAANKRCEKERLAKQRAEREHKEVVIAHSSDFISSEKYKEFSAMVLDAIGQGCNSLRLIREALGDDFQPRWFYDAIESLIDELDPIESASNRYMLLEHKRVVSVQTWGIPKIKHHNTKPFLESIHRKPKERPT